MQPASHTLLSLREFFRPISTHLLSCMRMNCSPSHRCTKAACTRSLHAHLRWAAAPVRSRGVIAFAASSETAIAVHASSTFTAWERLAHSIESSGGSCTRVVESVDGFGLRGLSTTQAVCPGDVLLSTPLHISISSADGAKGLLPWNIGMAVRLLQMLDEEAALAEQGRAGPHSAYLAMLPRQQTTPLDFSEEEVAFLEYAPICAAARDYQRALSEGWALCQEQDRLREAGTASIAFPMERLAWALVMVSSRTIRLAPLGLKFLFPGLDMLNHSHNPHGHLAMGKTRDGQDPTVQFVSDVYLGKGDQVLWSYGERRSSNDLFLYHGFVMPGNALNEDVVLFDSVEHLAGWYLDRMQHGGDGGSSGTAGGVAHAVLVEEAALVASEAMRQASAACTRGPRGGVRVVGTSSAILVPTAAASSLGSGSRGKGSGSSAGVIMLQEPEAQAAALASYAGLDLRSGERVTGSLRLHEPSWGDSSRPSDHVPELLGRGDRLVDVRLVAVSEFLRRRLASPTSSTGRSRGTDALMGPQDVVVARASELLQGFSTSMEEDRSLLQAARDLQGQQQLTADSGQKLERRIMSLDFRIAKKECLNTLAHR